MTLSTSVPLLAAVALGGMAQRSMVLNYKGDELAFESIDNWGRQYGRHPPHPIWYGSSCTSGRDTNGRDSAGCRARLVQLRPSLHSA